MKTKKEIFEWWEGRGKQKNLNDYSDFYNRIDKNILIYETQKGIGEKQKHHLKLFQKRWKYPINLYFYNLECFRITGF